MSKYLEDKVNDMAVRSAEDTYAKMQTEAFYQTAGPQPVPQAERLREVDLELANALDFLVRQDEIDSNRDKLQVVYDPILEEIYGPPVSAERKATEAKKYEYLEPPPGKERFTEEQINTRCENANLHGNPAQWMLASIIRQLQSDLASVCKTLENYEDILEKEKADHCDALEQLASIKAECKKELEEVLQVGDFVTFEPIIKGARRKKIEKLISKLEVEG